MRRRRDKKSITLIELLLAVIIAVFVLASLNVFYDFFMTHVYTAIEQSDMISQMNYAVEDMRLRCKSTVDVASGSFFDSDGEEKNSFTFLGEEDVFNVVPDDLTTKKWYRYQVDADGNLVLEILDDAAASVESREILVEADYHPELTFIYFQTDPPNFLVVRIRTTSDLAEHYRAESTIDKIEGLSFWFVTVVQ